MRTGRKPVAVWLRAWFAVGLLPLLAGLAACAQQPDRSHTRIDPGFLTVQPETAATLTAWPTAPAVITRPPSPTAAARPLWTASPQSTTAPSPTNPPAVAPTSTVTVTWAPLGANPPPVRLLIPSLGLDVPVVEVSWDLIFTDGSWQSVWQTADGAAGHHRNSANPGEAGNVVISGHHNTRGQVFREVSEIGQPGATFRQGDEVVLVAEDRRQYTYAVAEWERFEEEARTPAERQQNAHYLNPTSDPTLTLVTCWPYESNSHRVVVVAKLRP
jgi:LPXTG-site transpeptidase (sortase) family protein